MRLLYGISHRALLTLSGVSQLRSSLGSGGRSYRWNRVRRLPLVDIVVLSSWSWIAKGCWCGIVRWLDACYVPQCNHMLRSGLISVEGNISGPYNSHASQAMGRISHFRVLACLNHCRASLSQQSAITARKHCRCSSSKLQYATHY